MVPALANEAPIENVWHTSPMGCRQILLLVPLVLTSNAAISESMTWKCRFDLSATKDGLSKEATISFQLVADTVTEDAYLKSGSGIVPVTFLRGSEGELTFMDVTRDGSLRVTVVMPDGQAAHSQHPARDGKLLAAQSYGICR